tara:strand:- start:572 stop:838 length:267 start_codon:yes stop_codon:yes gene_type:complete
MRFEVKTDQARFSENFYLIYLIIIFTFISILITFLSVSLGKISKYYEIKYLCKLNFVEKSTSNFNKLKKLTNQINKQKIWDFCKEINK